MPHRSGRCAACRQAWSSSGVRRRGRFTVLIGINGFLTRLDSYHNIHDRTLHYLATYLHQLTSPSSYPVLPPDSSLLRLAVLVLRAAAVSGGVRAEGSRLAAASFAEALAMGGGTAAARPAEHSFGLRSRPPAISCSHGREGVTHGLEFGCGGKWSL